MRCTLMAELAEIRIISFFPLQVNDEETGLLILNRKNIKNTTKSSICYNASCLTILPADYGQWIGIFYNFPLNENYRTYVMTWKFNKYDLKVQ